MFSFHSRWNHHSHRTPRVFGRVGACLLCRVYIRAVYSNAHPSMTLVAVKTKVAPHKCLSIPRLELCGATILSSKLLNQVRHTLKMDLSHVVAWSDSTIVLHWLDGNPRCFKTFVGNRVASILEFLQSATWKHVPTTDNPADCASRGLLPLDLLHHSLWWEGPLWLHQEPPNYSEQPLTQPAVLPEVRAVYHAAMPSPPQLWLEERYSSYHKLLRVTAWCQRFIHNLRARKNNVKQLLTPCLSTTEVKTAEEFLFTMSQQRWFAEQRTRLSAGKSPKPSSFLLCLNPTIGSGGLLRVGGRLANAAFLSHSSIPLSFTGRIP